MSFQDPTALAIDKTLRDIRDVFYAWLQADPERDKDLAYSYAGAPIPLKMAFSRVKQERFIEDTLNWETELHEEEVTLARELKVPEEDILKIKKWTSPLRRQVEISLKKITYPLLQLWRKGPDFIFDLFRKGVNKEAYVKTVTPRMHKKKDFEDEIAEEERIESDDYEGPDEITADSELGI